MEEVKGRVGSKGLTAGTKQMIKGIHTYSTFHESPCKVKQFDFHFFCEKISVLKSHKDKASKLGLYYKWANILRNPLTWKVSQLIF